MTRTLCACMLTRMDELGDDLGDELGDEFDSQTWRVRPSQHRHKRLKSPHQLIRAKSCRDSYALTQSFVCLTRTCWQVKCLTEERHATFDPVAATPDFCTSCYPSAFETPGKKTAREEHKSSCPKRRLEATGDELDRHARRVRPSRHRHKRLNTKYACECNLPRL